MQVVFAPGKFNPVFSSEIVELRLKSFCPFVLVLFLCSFNRTSFYERSGVIVVVAIPVLAVRYLDVMVAF